MAFLGILVVAAGVVIWKNMDETGVVTGENGSGDKKTSGTDMLVAEKKLSTKASYQSPAGEEEIGITVMVNSEGVIVDANAEVLATHAISKTRQLAFAEGFPEALKGKKLSELTSIDKVGGSSLTTGAFNVSLTELKGQL